MMLPFKPSQPLGLFILTLCRRSSPALPNILSILQILPSMSTILECTRKEAHTLYLSTLHGPLHGAVSTGPLSGLQRSA